MISTMSESLRRCETLIATYDIQIGKYELLLTNAPRLRPCRKAIQMLIEKERRKLKSERCYRSRLLERHYQGIQG